MADENRLIIVTKTYFMDLVFVDETKHETTKL